MVVGLLAVAGVLMGCEGPRTREAGVPPPPAAAGEDGGDARADGEGARAREPARRPHRATTRKRRSSPPEYLAILERYKPKKPAKVRVLTAANRRLALDTQNVKRLHPSRTADVRGARQRALSLDDQAFEWRASRPIIVFQRSENGVWSQAENE